MPKVTVTISEQVFLTYQKELDLQDDQNPDELCDFEDWFCEDEGEVIQNNVNDRDFEFNCARCQDICCPAGTDTLSVYCEDCQLEIAQNADGVFKGEGI